MVRGRNFRHRRWRLANLNRQPLSRSYDDSILRSVGGRPLLQHLEVFQPIDRTKYTSNQRWGRTDNGHGPLQFQANMGMPPKQLETYSPQASEFQGSGNDEFVSPVDRSSHLLSLPILEYTWLVEKVDQESRTPSSVEHRKEGHVARDPLDSQQCMEDSNHFWCLILKSSKAHSYPLQHFRIGLLKDKSHHPGKKLKTRSDCKWEVSHWWPEMADHPPLKPLHKRLKVARSFLPANSLRCPATWQYILPIYRFTIRR